jgi:hypothetical protein
MAHVVTHLVHGDVLMLFKVRIKLGPWICMGNRNLNRFTIELLSKLHGALDGLRRFSWQSNDAVAVHHNAQPLTLLHKGQGLLDSGAFFDVLENL